MTTTMVLLLLLLDDDGGRPMHLLRMTRCLEVADSALLSCLLDDEKGGGDNYDERGDVWSGLLCCSCMRCECNDDD